MFTNWDVIDVHHNINELYKVNSNIVTWLNAIEYFLCCYKTEFTEASFSMSDKEVAFAFI